jgi:hypothetical protein
MRKIAVCSEPSAVQRKHAQVTAIFQIAQKYVPSLVRNVNSTVDVEVWIMGGVVLLGLVISILSKVVTWHKQYLCGPNVCHDRMRVNCGINGHNPLSLSFLGFFFFHFPSQTPSGMTGKPRFSL